MRLRDLDRLGAAESRIFLAEAADGRALGFVQLFPSFSSVSMRRLWILNDLGWERDGTDHYELRV